MSRFGRSPKWPLLVALALATASSGAPSAAQTTSCPSVVTTWVDEMSRAQRIAVAPADCHPGFVRVRLRPANASPLDIEIDANGRPGFRRVGPWSISPIVNVPDFRMLPQGQRDGFEAVVAWIETNRARVHLSAPSAPRIVPSRFQCRIETCWTGPWIALLALVFGMFTMIRARPKHALGVAALASLFIASLALRTVFGPWGPLHVNGQGAFWVSAAFSRLGWLGAYGPGYAEIFGPIARAFPRNPDYAIFATNAVLSALVPPMLAVLARSLGVDRRSAVLAAVVAVLDPVAIRTAATEGYFTPILVLVIASALSIVVAHRAASARDWVTFVSAALAAGLFAAQAVRTHPIAYPPVALLPLTVFAAHSTQQTVRRAAVSFVVATGVLLAVIVVSSGGWILAAMSQLQSGGDVVHLPRGSLSGHFVATRIALPLVVFVALGAWLRPRRLVIPALVCIVALALTRRIYGQSQIWQSSFERVYVWLPFVAYAGAIPSSVAERWQRWVWVLFGAVAAAMFVLGARRFGDRTTQQREYAWLRSEFGRLPDGCTVAYVGRAAPRVLYVPEYRLPGYRAGRSSVATISSSEDLLALRTPGRCIYYLHASTCTSTQGRPLCAEIESHDVPSPVAETAVPAVPDFDALPYDRALVRLHLHRLPLTLAPAPEVP